MQELEGSKKRGVRGKKVWLSSVSSVTFSFISFVNQLIVVCIIRFYVVEVFYIFPLEFIESLSLFWQIIFLGEGNATLFMNIFIY